MLLWASALGDSLSESQWYEPGEWGASEGLTAHVLKGVVCGELVDEWQGL